MRDFSTNHYERAFENWLLDHGLKYTRCDEHRRLGPCDESVKNFDFLVYPASGCPVIAEVKGRTFTGTGLAGLTGLECWVTLDDIESLRTWRQALGPSHEAAFVFVYHVVKPDVDLDGHEVLNLNLDRYVFFCVRLDDYLRLMRRRSPKWHTMTLSAADFRGCAVSLATFLLASGPSNTGSAGDEWSHNDRMGSPPTNA